MDKTSIKSKKGISLIINKDSGDKLSQFHNEVAEHLNIINDKYNLNYYEMIGVLEAIIFMLHDDALSGEEDNDN